MSKNASSVSVRRKTIRKPDNPQETLQEQNYYFTGFFAAEMTCSVIKAANRNPVGHYYFAIDMTVTNADTKVLRQVNKIVMGGKGVLSPVKGAYNLSARGQARVRKVLDFFLKYPIIAGDYAQSRVFLMRETLEYLNNNRGHKVHSLKIQRMDEIRAQLRAIKESGLVLEHGTKPELSPTAVGHFLAGVLAGEGSFGSKRSGKRQQPYFMVAMKDRKIIELFRDFLGHGNVRLRKDGLYHYELNSVAILQQVIPMFLHQFPLRHTRQTARMKELQRILNDYTRNRVKRRG